MDLTYWIVAVFGICVVRPCSPLPTTTAAVAAALAPTPTAPTLQVAAAEPAGGGRSGKRSRSLFQSPLQYRPQTDDAYDDAMDDGLMYVPQRPQLQYRPQAQNDPAYEDGLRTMDADEDDDVDQDLRLSSRARPGGKPVADSPVYFIRLPPQPYSYVPGYGYVSQPTRLEPPPFEQRPHSPFLNLPLSFMSNAKPVGVYTLPQQQQQHQYQQQQPQYQPQPQYQQPQYQQPPFPGRPKPNRRPQVPAAATPPPQPEQQPDSPVYNLDKGPYVFNGRPTDVFLLQSAYDNLYSEVLQNIYP